MSLPSPQPSSMSPLHTVLAIGVAVTWGIAFVISKIGLESFTPAQLTALRFLIASAAIFFVPRPDIPVPILLAIGLTVFTGQFLLQFFGIAYGMPAGLTAVVSQTQALFTVLFAALVLGDRPNGRQMTGMAIAFAGLFLIAMTIGGTITLAGFMLTLASAVSWAIGNVLIKRLPRVDMLRLVVWASLVPPLPALAISMALDGPANLVASLTNASLMSWMAPLYLGVLASVVAYAIWGGLLQRYPAGAVAPFALLAPCVGTITSALLLGEEFGPLRTSGVVLMLLGLAVIAVPLHLFRRASRPA